MSAGQAHTDSIKSGYAATKRPLKLFAPAKARGNPYVPGIGFARVGSRRHAGDMGRRKLSSEVRTATMDLSQPGVCASVSGLRDACLFATEACSEQDDRRSESKAAGTL